MEKLQIKLPTILLGLALLSASLFFTQCVENPWQASQLPKEMPATVEFEYRTGGGMMGDHKTIRISGDVLSVKEKKGSENPKTWSAGITTADKEKLYQTFVENNFDLIKSTPPKGKVYDGVARHVWLKVENKSYNVSYGTDYSMSSDSLKRFEAVVGAFYDLASQYEGKGKPAVAAGN